MLTIQIASPSRHQCVPLFRSRLFPLSRVLFFSKKEFRDNSVAVLKDIAATFIGMVTSAWVTMTLDNTLRSARPGKIRSAVTKEEEERRKTERIPTQHSYQAHFIKVASPFPRLCCNIAHQHDTKRGAHICGERSSLHRSLVVPPYIHVYKSICVEGVSVLIWLR